jgi:PelA/Pel-15E family pectate lyase
MNKTNRAAMMLVGLLVATLGAGNALATYTSARNYLDKPAEWFKGDEAAKIAANLLSYQSSLGGWPKNLDTAAAPYTGDRAELHATFDNSATTDELRYIARMYDATQDAKYRDAFLKGLDYILKAQYPNGGWPQSFPPKPAYASHITFNDGAMARLMFFVKEIATDDQHEGFVDTARRKACLEAWSRGIDCILKCQIKVNGKLTAWCAQHDETTFAPAPARTFEPVSISGCESVGIVHVLMNVEHPSPQIVQAINAAVAWLDSVKIPGIRVEDRPQANTPKGYERFVVADPSAPPMWARFYEIGTNKPIFSDRDSVIKYKLSDIGIERRTGYQWLKYWPKNLIEKDYPAWQARIANASAAAGAAKSN